MQTVKLGTICDIQAGGTPSRAEPVYWKNGTIPWVKISDFDGGNVRTTEESITQEGLDNSSAKLFPKGTILYTIFATLGEVAVLQMEAATNQAIAGLHLHDERIDAAYLYYFLISIKEKVLRLGRGVTQNNINLKILRNIDVPVTHLAEQQRIVRELQQVGALLANRRQVDEQLAELPKARFVEMFGDPVVNPMGWKVVHIKDICTVSSSKRLYQKDLTSSGIPFLKIADLVAKINGTPENPTSCLTERAYDDLRQQNAVPQANDILVTARGTLGLCYIVQPEDRFYFQDGMISWLRTSDARIEPVFLTTLFQLPIVRLQIQKVVTGSTIAYLSLEQLADFRVPLPPLPAQRRFAAFARACAAQRAACARQIAVLETLRGKLLQDAFGAAG